MVNDVVKTVKAQLYERVTSPLFSTFIISWSLWNYKFILLILDKTKYEQKLLLIDEVLYPDVLHYVGLNFIGPLLTALTMIYLYPIPAKKVFEHYRTQQLKLKLIQQKIEDETPLTIEESRTIRQHALSIELEFHSQLKKRDEEIADLKKAILELNNGKENLPVTTDIANTNITDTQFIDNLRFKYDDEPPDLRSDMDLVLYIIGSLKRPIYEDILNRVKMDDIGLRHTIDKLTDYGLVASTYNQDIEDYVFYPTKIGRLFIVNSNLYKDSNSISLPLSGTDI